jgi:hypothetical protein
MKTRPVEGYLYKSKSKEMNLNSELLQFMTWYKKTIPVCTQKDSFEIVNEYFESLQRGQNPPNLNKNNWIDISVNPPIIGTEVLFFNEKWINEDWNPNGIRVGFLDDMNGYTSAYWCNYHDEYHTRISGEDNKNFEDSKGANQVPTHWLPMPILIKKGIVNE